MTLTELRAQYATKQAEYFQLQDELNALLKQIDELEMDEPTAGTITIKTTFADGTTKTHDWEVSRKPIATEIQEHLNIKYWHGPAFTWVVTAWTTGEQ